MEKRLNEIDEQVEVDRAKVSMEGGSKMTVAQIEKTTQLVCPGCNLPAEELDLEPIYECGGCGEIFSRSNSADGDSHKCPGCNKFSTKVTDEGCANCGEELEGQDTYIYKDESYSDLDDLVDAIKQQGEQLPDWLQDIEEHKMLRADERAHKQAQYAEFTARYPLWVGYTKYRGAPIIVTKACEADTYKGLEAQIEGELGRTALPVDFKGTAGWLTFENATIDLEVGCTTYYNMPLDCVAMVIKPKYQVGQELPQIDLSSMGCFNRYFFTSARIISATLQHSGEDNWVWGYAVESEKGKTNITEAGITTQTGQHPDKEWCYCPNGCISILGFPEPVRYYEPCPKCGYNLQAAVKTYSLSSAPSLKMGATTT